VHPISHPGTTHWLQAVSQVTELAR
jgi:hypothetical protein